MIEQRKNLALLLGLSLVAASANANEEMINQGKALTSENCVQCHGSEVYTRADRKIKSMQKLEAQVRRCDTNLKTQLFDDELEAIAQYLNSAYYKF